MPGLGLRPEIAKKANFMKGKGCSHCNKTGYRGRMGIYELMIMTTQIREMTFKGESTQNIRRVARKQGMRTLFEDGMIKAIKGLTTLDEVLRITQHDMVSEGLIAAARRTSNEIDRGHGRRPGRGCDAGPAPGGHADGRDSRSVKSAASH